MIKTDRKKTWSLAGLIIASAAIIGMFAMLHARDADTLWIIATGREILKNGILHTNPFTIDQTGIVVQQWLYDVLFAVFYKAGHAGYYLFACVNAAVLAWSAWVYFAPRKVNYTRKILLVVALCACIICFHAPTRPETITVALLIFTCSAIERYLNNKKTAILILLPILMVLEVNLHASMIWFHFAVILTYLIPSFSKRICDGVRVKGSFKPILLFTAASAAAMFLNPYGMTVVMYLPRALTSGTFRIISIDEMQPLFIVGGFYVATFFIALIPVIYLAVRGRVKNYQVYMAAGAAIMTLFSVRNILFLFIPAFSALGTILEETKEAVSYKDGTSRAFRVPGIMLVLFVLDVYLCFNLRDEIAIAMESEGQFAEDIRMYDGVASIEQYIEDNCDDKKNVRLFTGVDIGGFFEFMGYENIYTDPRPELFMKNLNGSKDILPTYSVLRYGDKEEVASVMPQLLDEYQFNYLVVAEKGVLDYLNEEETNYELVLTTKPYCLYEYCV